MKNKKHSHEFKVKVVNEYLNNEGEYTYLGKKHNVNPSIIRKWVIMYEQFGAKMSMSRKGNCLDNSPMENFFGLLKQEMFYGESFNSYKDLEEEIHEYINYYNKHRIKIKLKGMSPEQFRKHTLELA
ncbi:IS3 family transposase [Nosocomiicoccus massiliensis]|uniref:IS3 family transposase n=1 Tax=Nosocomiicoccus massiliensis TaxID=1232430 RepID=A0AAF0YLQ7_9STAP|nr:IS3 family transposase [Nosocomiicoccus massiliensis]WOS95447.1 IS3 family transposase [Nosocomiicoccus massiliensis]